MRDDPASVSRENLISQSISQLNMRFRSRLGCRLRISWSAWLLKGSIGVMDVSMAHLEAVAFPIEAT
jgi:hypothetical protein